MIVSICNDDVVLTLMWSGGLVLTSVNCQRLEGIHQCLEGSQLNRRAHRFTLLTVIKVGHVSSPFWYPSFS